MRELVEVWKPIMGYEGVYEVSNLGRVRSLDRLIKTGRGGLQFREGTILKGKLDRYGYIIYGLYKNGNGKFFSIHRLVAMHFIPNPDNLPQVNHKDEDKNNNIVWVNEDGSIDYDKSNLEWCDAKYNNNYGTRNNRISKGQKNDKKKSKPVIQLTLNNEIIGFYPSIKEAARQIGIGSTEISKCCNKKLHYNSSGGFKWTYLDDYLSYWWDKEMDTYMEKEKAA